MNPEIHLTQDELQQLAGLTRDQHWPLLVRYLESVKESANKSMRKLSNSLQAYGYWAGVIQVIEDIENLPLDVAKIIHAEKDAGHEE